MACTPARSDEIAELAAGRLDEAALASALDHLELCADCSAELDAVACVLAEAPGGLERAPGTGPARWPWRLAAAAAALVLAFALAELFAPERIADRDFAGVAGVADLADARPLPAPLAVLRGAGETPVTEEADAFDTGARAYAAGEWAVAAERFEEAARAGRAAARLYAGIARLQAGELDAAREHLAHAARDTSDLEREQALWYLANAALAADDPGAARAALEQLVAEDGDYALNAESALERLAERLGR